MEFDKYADNYDAGFMGKGSGRFYADLIKEIEVKDGDAVLDVGCGTGTVFDRIRTLPGESICKTVGSHIPYYSGKHNPFIFRRGEFFFFLGLGICSWSNCLLGT